MNTQDIIGNGVGLDITIDKSEIYDFELVPVVANITIFDYTEEEI